MASFNYARFARRLTGPRHVRISRLFRAPQKAWTTVSSPEFLKISVDEIGPEGLALDVKLETAWLSELLGADLVFKPDGEGRLTVRLDRAGEIVHVRGRVHCNLQAPCGRCLEGLGFEINVPVEVAMFPVGSEPEAGPDGELAEEDLGVATYDGKTVDLTAIVRDEVFLEMPMNPICHYAAAEECPNFQRNVGNVPRMEEEKRTGIDPRWAALQKLKLS
jgi:uncharacterized protein